MKKTLLFLLLSLPAAARNPVYSCTAEEAKAHHLPPLSMRFSLERSRPAMKKFPEANAYFLSGPTPPGGVWQFEIRAYRNGHLPIHPAATAGSLVVAGKKRQAFAYFLGSGPARAERCLVIIPYDASSGAILYCAASSSQTKADPQHFADWLPLKSFGT